MKSRVWALVVVVLAVWPGWIARGFPLEQAGSQVVTYICPMHPDVRTNAPGNCPRCGMALVTTDPLDMRDYRLEIATIPHPPPAGRRVRVRLTVRDPDTNEVVRQFAVVHEKVYHLFVISQDLEHYAHLHPEQDEDGAFAVDLILPRAGYYKIYSDFLPIGGTPQVIPRLLVTSGFDGDLATSRARLVPDTRRRKMTGSISVALEIPGDGLIAGRDEKFTYRLSDAASGAPVTDIEPYLGAWGHSLIMSEDTLDFVHAHPLELLPEGTVGATGGPLLTFTGLLAKPGTYRIWAQVKRKGEVSTVAFTVAVAPAIVR